jgi:hypothetical protein
VGTIYDILHDLIKLLIERKNLKRANLASYLGAIADLLDQARLKFSERKLPRRESKELAVLINHADMLAEAFKDELRGLKEIFDQRLPKIGGLMRVADLYINEKPHYRLNESFGNKNAPFSDLHEAGIQEACTEMEPVAGELNAYKRILAQKT